MRTSRMPRIALATSLLGWSAVLLAGCSSATYSSPSGAPLIIETQPLSQTVPISQTAIFTVAATGTGSLSYQWSENGTEISGATSASYTTPAVTLGADGSTSIGSFQVTVKDSSNSVTSNAVTLTAGPRSPKPGDLRYLLDEQVDLPGLNPTAIGGGDNTLASYPNAVGTPLSMGTCSLIEGCGWEITTFNLPAPMTDLTMWYNCGFNPLGSGYPSFTSDLESVVASNVVVTSLDIETAESTYAMSWVSAAQGGGFDYKLETVPQAQLQATADADGAASRVITAATFDDSTGMADLISYGWTGDTATAYETQTSIVPRDEVQSATTILAGKGYIVSAFGGNDIDGYMLIGMRVAGDTLPRPIVVDTSNGTILADDPDSSTYFTTVVNLQGLGHTIINEQ